MASDTDKQHTTEFLNSAFWQAHLELPDWSSWFGPDADYVDDGDQGVRMRSGPEMDEQHMEFRIHALRQALLLGEPHYQYLIALALLEGQWGLQPARLLKE